MTADQVEIADRFGGFPIQLELSNGPDDFLRDAADAVKWEHRQTAQWKKIRCLAVRRVKSGRQDDQSKAAIYALDVGRGATFDWTWEGARAIRPVDLHEFENSTQHSHSTNLSLNADQVGVIWSGEIIEVDQSNGRIFICVDPNERPTCGTFFARPFDFLRNIYDVFCSPSFEEFRRLMPARLSACRGRVHPRSEIQNYCGLPELEEVWSHTWGVIWGPPGTGKTFTIGQQLAAHALDPTERFLVVSSTNKATDTVALAIGRSWREVASSDIDDGRVLRIGKSPYYRSFLSNQLTGMLQGTETELLAMLGQLNEQLAAIQDPEQRAIISQHIAHLRGQLQESSRSIFVSPEARVVISTAYKATSMIANPVVQSMLRHNCAPFTTVVIDEAGLMSRAVVAVLSLFASRRVILVGDPKQLAPIARNSRVLPTNQSTWLASNSLRNLHSMKQRRPSVFILETQHRMHPEISAVVSVYQYEGRLNDGAGVTSREFEVPPSLDGEPRAIWYVLDEETDNLSTIRAQRGPDARSWVRPVTRSVLGKILSDPEIRRSRGLFVTPFVAQARDIAGYFAEEGIKSWTAATIHSVQGIEADYVVFDTVNANSTGWQADEWQRLINVGISRAREFLFILASRAEMQQPYLSPLVPYLGRRVLTGSGQWMTWRDAAQKFEFQVPEQIKADPNLLGSQIARRKQLCAVPNAEQQWLCDLKMDGKPRLVRGVAGSGKTAVMANWLVKTVQRLADKPDAKIWAVYANNALRGLLGESIEEAWSTEANGTAFPWHQVDLYHVRSVLDMLLPVVGAKMYKSDYEYDQAAKMYLERLGVENIVPLCDALFVDETQDMGPATLQLLSLLVEQADPDDPKSRAVNFFYDNAQNLYDRGMPTWSEMGLDMRGRSTVMKESFRSTQPITEFAINVLYRLESPESDPDHKELVRRGLIELTERNGEPWWKVSFNQVDGPLPIFRRFQTLDKQLDAMGDQIVHWIQEEGVIPGDICILYVGKFIAKHIKQQIEPKLKKIGAQLLVQTRQVYERDNSTVIVTTPNSFKGYESEITVIAAVDEFVVPGRGILAKNLYVAMTRARSLLAVYGKQRGSPEVEELISTIDTCWNNIASQAGIESEDSALDNFEDLVTRLGTEHRPWLSRLWKNYAIQQEPIIVDDGEILGEPLFWFQNGKRSYACFENTIGARARHRLNDAGIDVIAPGQDFGSKD